ncbi:MAG: DUF4276 family protein [Saprospiraceae bacterium]|nr:DUF4276 family protein [Saprospiraceae bacterium]
MVKITIIIEGAPLPHPNVAAATMSNVVAFREAFRKLFQSGITNTDLSFQIMNGGPDRNAVKMFLSSDNQILLIDLEGRPNTRLQRLESFHDLGFDIQVHAGNTFFMVQKMEAWFLSQPDKIELLLAKQKVTTHTIANDGNLLNHHPESIVHPDSVLNVILMRNFEENRNGRQRRMKYTGKKLTLAPRLLEILDIERLRGTFSDVRDLLEKLNGHHQ